MWLIEKSAGEAIHYVAVFVDGPIGHTWEEANKIANELNEVAAQFNSQQAKNPVTRAVPDLRQLISDLQGVAYEIEKPDLQSVLNGIIEELEYCLENDAPQNPDYGNEGQQHT